jgi:hypothetical protein
VPRRILEVACPDQGEHAAGSGIAESLIPEVTLGDFVGALRSSKVRHHRRIAEKVPQ